MAFARAARRPLGVFFYSGFSSGNEYSTVASKLESLLHYKNSVSPRYASPFRGFGSFLQSFSSESAPAVSDQISLIKQLRQRTSAPIKDVKASLVEFAVIELNCETDFVARNDIFQYLALFLSKDLVSSEALANEREILKSQAESTGKSQMAVEKMVEGRLRKYYEEVALMEQKFIVNDAINIKTLVDNLSKEMGSPVKIANFLRVEVGEGIERLEASDEPVAQTA
ncbi:hypothetical protein Bca4012_018899 [Brassica carinata]